MPAKYGSNCAVTVWLACTLSISQVVPSVPLVRVQALAATNALKRQPVWAVAVQLALSPYATACAGQLTLPPTAGWAAPVRVKVWAWQSTCTFATSVLTVPLPFATLQVWPAGLVAVMA